MRNKLALTIALGALAATIGVGIASVTPAVDSAGGQIQLPDVTQIQLPACADGVDNDGDGLFDLADPDCLNALGTSEGNGPAPPSTSGGGDDTVQIAPAPPKPSGGGTGGGGHQGGSGGKNKGAGANGKTGGVGPSGRKDARRKLRPPPEYRADGTPTVSNPSTMIAPFGPAPMGVPNFVIDQFEIPPFLLPIYQACGTQYAIPWQVLASINKVETAFGTNLNVSTAGAVGWMQFLPSTWKAYGVDANGDKHKDPYNPVDAICAAARYLRAAGGEEDLRSAIFAYNHADWYVDEILLFARGYGRISSDLLGSLTGLTEGAHFPVAANARYADDISAREALARAKPSKRAEFGNAADVITSSPTRRGINIFSREGAPIVAVNDGVIKQIGESERLGKYIVLQDAYGNRFTYAELGHVVRVHPVPKPQQLTAADFKLVSPPEDARPTGPATVGSGAGGGGDDNANVSFAKPVTAPEGDSKTRRTSGPVNTEDARPRLYALPGRPHNQDRASLGGQLDDLAGQKLPGYETFKNYFDDVFGFNRRNTELRSLHEGSKVIGGTVLGRMGGSVDGTAPHVNFAIRPAGRGAPRIDPKPILDGWKLLEATAIYRAAGKNPFATNLGVGGVLLMSKEALQRRVLADPRMEIYSCGRTDIRSGQIDRRVLATLEFLAEKGFRLTVTSLKCGHGFYTASGNVSNHSSGNAVDIARINGISVLGHQGPGTLTDALLKSVLQLQGTMAPEELISLENLGGPSFALGDHADHVHIGWQPLYGNGRLNQQFVQLLKPDQWERLIGRLGDIQNPVVPTKVSKAALPTGDGGKARKRASDAHVGE